MTTPDVGARIARWLRMSAEERHDLYQRHGDAGTCWQCERPVAAGELVYSPTGEHMDCYRARAPRSVDAPYVPTAAPGRYLARAAGGHLVHTVDTATNQALCGHTLRHTARRMRRRSRWIPHHEISACYPRCPRCALRHGDPYAGAAN